MRSTRITQGDPGARTLLLGATMPTWTRCVSLSFVALLFFLVGCGGHSAKTARMRTALDNGRPREAIAALDDELDVEGGAMPKALRIDDNALLVLDRATIHQAVGEFQKSKRDYEAADKALDVLDLSHGAADDVARATYSDSAGRYVAPPHEKILLNVLNMLNYLEMRDLSGARVEARRMVVMSRFLRDFERHTDASLGVGSLLAGFAFEKSGQDEEAARFYGDAARIGELGDEARLFDPDDPEDDDPEDDDAEVLIVIGDGRVPHRIENRVPIGLALTRASPALADEDRTRASAFAAQGLVTWVNFPSLAPARDPGSLPTLRIDGRSVPLERALDVTALVQSHWRKVEGGVMAAAVSRTVTRVALGAAVGAIVSAAASKSDKKSAGGLGSLVSLIIQAGMTAADVPDTRSWETLPARISIARARLPPGAHDVHIEARGTRRTGRVIVEPRGWATLSLLALR